MSSMRSRAASRPPAEGGGGGVLRVGLRGREVPALGPAEGRKLDV